MPVPSKNPGEDKQKFLSRCMSDDTMKKEYEGDKRMAICLSKAIENSDYVEAADFSMNVKEYGFTEEINENNFVVPSDEDYVDFGEETEEWDWAADRPGLWENIRKKKEREGKNYKPAKPGDKDRPDPDSWKKAQSKFKYRNPKTGQVFEYDRKGVYTKNGTTLVPVKAVVVNNQKVKERFEYVDAETGITYIFDKPGDHKSENGNTLEYVGIWGDFSSAEIADYESETTKSAEYQGRKVQLGKPFRTPKGPKKFSVYVKNPKGNVVKVNFGDPNMKIKKSDPARRKSFRARHNCANPGPRHKARYWSCRKW